MQMGLLNDENKQIIESMGQKIVGYESSDDDKPDKTENIADLIKNKKARQQNQSKLQREQEGKKQQMELEIIRDNIRNGVNAEILTRFVDPDASITVNGTFKTDKPYKYEHIKNKIQTMRSPKNVAFDLDFKK